MNDLLKFELYENSNEIESNWDVIVIRENEKEIEMIKKV